MSRGGGKWINPVRRWAHYARTAIVSSLLRGGGDLALYEPFTRTPTRSFRKSFPFVCAHCGGAVFPGRIIRYRNLLRYVSQAATLDHVFSRHDNGSENLVTSCATCNSERGEPGIEDPDLSRVVIAELPLPIPIALGRDLYELHNPGWVARRKERDKQRLAA